MNKQLRMLVILGMLFGMLASLFQPSTASAASVSSATFTAGVVSVTNGSNTTHYAKSNAQLTLRVTTLNDVKCVELTGAHTATQSQGSANKTTWDFSLTALTGNGVRTVTASAYQNSNCRLAGSETLTTKSASYTLDNTGPVITPTLTPAPNTDGWNNSTVTVSYNCIDPAGVSGCPVNDSATQNGRTTFTGRIATDTLGNQTTLTPDPSVLIDRDAPLIGGSRAPAANDFGWNNTDVTVSFSCLDGGSQIKSCSGPSTLTGNNSSANTSQSVTGTAVDKADNTATATVGGINIDKIAPTLSGTPTNANLGNNGWYRGNVTVTWSANDALSGLASAVPGNSTISGEGQNLTATQTVSDKAGNSTTASSPAVKIDRTVPNTTATAPANWNNTNVTVSLNPSDALSGVAATYYTLDGGAQRTYNSTDKVVISSEGVHTLQFWSVDNAGNAETAKSVQVKIDLTYPTINHSQSPAANNNGWNNTNVTVTFICGDTGGSGLASCTSAQTVTTEGQNQAVTGTATDNAGNTATDPATVSIDKTEPMISAAADREQNENGWYDDDVIVSFRASDALSGIDGNPGSQTLGEGAGQRASAMVTDAAGNSATASVTGINVDKTAPTLTGTPSTTGWSRDDVTVTWAANDALSGLAVAVPADSIVSGEGDNRSTSASVIDNAGNTKTTTVSGIKIDRSAPRTTASVEAPLATGWYDKDVEVTLTPVDRLSGIAKTFYSVDDGAAQEYTGKFTHTLKGEHTITFWSVDVAGNVENKTDPGHSLTLKLDGTPPTTTISLPAAFATGWYADKVTVAFAASDAETGVSKTYFKVDDGAAQEYDGTFEHTLDDTHTIFFWSVDSAGNVETAKSQEIKVDTGEPTITGSRTPEANSFGWNNSDVTVSFICADSHSGVAIENCTPVTPVKNEGAGQSVTGTATDNVGKTASTTVGNINIDKTAPTLSGAPTTQPNASGWYKGNVTVAWTAGDALSGLAGAAPADSTITGEGSNLGAGPVNISDKAGNIGSGSVSGIKIDRTAPGTPSFSGIAAQTYAPASLPMQSAISCSAMDGLSGFDSCTVTGYSNAAGPHTLTATASDKAGNTSTSTLQYTVQEPIRVEGFYRPVDMTAVGAPTKVYQQIKAGATVPLKFRVYSGVNEVTSTTGMSVKVSSLTCDSAGTVVADDIGTTTSAAGLRYDIMEKQFVFNWAVNKTVGTCYKAAVVITQGSTPVTYVFTSVDGVQQEALFRSR